MPAKKVQAKKVQAKRKTKTAPVKPVRPDATKAVLDEILAALRGPAQVSKLPPVSVSEEPEEVWPGLVVTNNEYTFENLLSKVNTTSMLMERLRQDVDTMKVQLGNVIQRVNAR